MKRNVFISIIPNQPLGKKSPIFFIFILLLLSVFFAVSLFFLIRLFSSNNSVLIQEADVRTVEKENRTLKKAEEEIKETFEITKKKADRLDEAAKRVEPLLGIQKLPDDGEFSLTEFSLTQRLDSLLTISKKNREVFSYASDKLLNNKKLSSSIPSIKPVAGWLVKGYGYINDLFTDQIRLHPGITFSAMKGAPVYATGNGSIIRKGMESGIGLFVEINHGFGYITKYGHLQSARVKEGDYVKRGNVIGYVGKTGRVTGPCLYYEIIMNGKRTDPLNFILEYVETMESEFSK